MADPHHTVLAGGVGSGRWSELWGRGCRVDARVVGAQVLSGVFEGWGLVKAYSGPQGAPRVWTPRPGQLQEGWGHTLPPENLVLRARDAGPEPRWSRGSLHRAETGASGAGPSGEGATHGTILLAPLRVQEGLEGLPLTQSPRMARGPEELQTFGDLRGTQAPSLGPLHALRPSLRNRGLDCPEVSWPLAACLQSGLAPTSSW